jgi:hypothetical protein
MSRGWIHAVVMAFALVALSPVSNPTILYGVYGNAVARGDVTPLTPLLSQSATEIAGNGGVG